MGSDLSFTLFKRKTRNVQRMLIRPVQSTLCRVGCPLVSAVQTQAALGSAEVSAIGKKKGKQNLSCQRASDCVIRPLSAVQVENCAQLCTLTTGTLLTNVLRAIR